MELREVGVCPQPLPRSAGSEPWRRKRQTATRWGRQPSRERPDPLPVCPGGRPPGAPKGVANLQWPPPSGSDTAGQGCAPRRPSLLLTRGPGWRPQLRPSPQRPRPWSPRAQGAVRGCGRSPSTPARSVPRGQWGPCRGDRPGAEGAGGGPGPGFCPTLKSPGRGDAGMVLERRAPCARASGSSPGLASDPSA